MIQPLFNVERVRERPVRILALVADGLQAGGGIAGYNRELFDALTHAYPGLEICLAPRHSADDDSPLPPRITELPARAGRVRYALRAMAMLVQRDAFDLVFCGHLYMGALAALLARRAGCPLWMQLHGVEAWDSPRRSICAATREAALVTAVSRYTRRRFLQWSGVEPHRVRVLPNTYSARFQHGTRPQHLRERHGLTGGPILLTVSRLVATEREKGHDRIIAMLPRLLVRWPNAMYVIAGEGDDRPRLERLCEHIGVAAAVRFLGRISQEELPDYFRLADVYVMPSTQEGFGIVFLEAAACGLPVVGGRCDGSWDALREGRLGQAIDPDDPDALFAAIATALGAGNAMHDQAAVEVFSRSHFRDHVARISRELLKEIGTKRMSNASTSVGTSIGITP